MSMPNMTPKIPSQAETQLGSFFAAKDMADRNPGGSKKIWPVVLAGILLALVVTLFVGFYIASHSGREEGRLSAGAPAVSGVVSQQAAAE